MSRPTAPTFRETLSAITLVQAMQGDARYQMLPLGIQSLMGMDWTKQKPCVLHYSRGPCNARLDCEWIVKEEKLTISTGYKTVVEEWCQERMAQLSTLRGQ